MSKEHTQDNIGKLLDDTAQRDAIHIAVLPVVSGDTRPLKPGDPIALVEPDKRFVTYFPRAACMGIVDPYLTDPVQFRERFYMFLLPNTVTGMRHHWEHSKIDHEPIVEPMVDSRAALAARAWLMDFAERWNMDFAELVRVASEGDMNELIIANGVDVHSPKDLGEDYAEFWRKFELATGRAYDEDHRNRVVWSCSC